MKVSFWTWRKCVMGVAAVALGAAALAHATNYSLWINGRTGGGQLGNHADFSYWGPASTAAGVNKKSVNWDGYNTVASQNFLVRDALDCYCTGGNWCYVAAHSAGNLQIGYATNRNRTIEFFEHHFFKILLRWSHRHSRQKMTIGQYV